LSSLSAELRPLPCYDYDADSIRLVLCLARDLTGLPSELSNVVAGYSEHRRSRVYGFIESNVPLSHREDPTHYNWLVWQVVNPSAPYHAESAVLTDFLRELVRFRGLPVQTTESDAEWVRMFYSKLDGLVRRGIISMKLLE
jgi:hypothetical protein